jgi:hypothetical protein
MAPLGVELRTMVKWWLDYDLISFGLAMALALALSL